MATPIIGDLIESTVGKVTDKLIEKYLPASMSESEKAAAILEARRMAIEEYKIVMDHVQGARDLAGKESEGGPEWAKVLTVTHRPVWSFVMLGVFVWTVIAPSAGFFSIPLTPIHKEIMQTVIIFYFGGRSIEKAVGIVKGK